MMAITLKKAKWIRSLHTMLSVLLLNWLTLVDASLKWAQYRDQLVTRMCILALPLLLTWFMYFMEISWIFRAVRAMNETLKQNRISRERGEDRSLPTSPSRRNGGGNPETNVCRFHFLFDCIDMILWRTGYFWPTFVFLVKL